MDDHAFFSPKQFDDGEPPPRPRKPKFAIVGAAMLASLSVIALAAFQAIQQRP